MLNHKQRRLPRSLPTKWMDYLQADDGAAVLIEAEQASSAMQVRIDGARVIVFYVAYDDSVSTYYLRGAVLTCGYGGKIIQAPTTYDLLSTTTRISALDAIPHPDFPSQRWVIAYYLNPAVGDYSCRAGVVKLEDDGTLTLPFTTDIETDLVSGAPSLVPWGDAANPSYIGITYTILTPRAPTVRILDVISNSLVKLGTPQAFPVYSGGGAPAAPLAPGKFVAFYESQYDAQVASVVTRSGSSSITFSPEQTIVGGDFQNNSPSGSSEVNQFPGQRRTYSLLQENGIYLLVFMIKMLSRSRFAPPGGSWGSWTDGYVGQAFGYTWDSASPDAITKITGITARPVVQDGVIGQTGADPLAVFPTARREVYNFSQDGDTVGEGALFAYDRDALGVGVITPGEHSTAFHDLHYMVALDEIRVVATRQTDVGTGLEARIIYAGGNP